MYHLCWASQVVWRRHQALQQQLVPEIMSQRAEANEHDISNVLYGMADSG
jgi:hypothetical protein